MDYKSPRWRSLRLRVLRRDRYLCRECRRYGRTTQASVAHHVWPATEYPEYEWAEENLIALCPACHNAMHDRDRDGALTDAGLAWARRIPPPSFGAAERAPGDRWAGPFPTAEKTGQGVNACVGANKTPAWVPAGDAPANDAPG